MLDRQHSRIVIECDSCDATEESEKGEQFEPFWSRLKNEGWKAKRIGNDWVHGCPKCGI